MISVIIFGGVKTQKLAVCDLSLIKVSELRVPGPKSKIRNRIISYNVNVGDVHDIYMDRKFFHGLGEDSPLSNGCRH
ncbi:hypothetical protein CEXT_33031 [Caerostris extrusa]|uniref:Uncharacterized protein n=1 Tax=Caerostris extrusa TaxID=172846 RepID=A0AAV4VUZ4_CAEEX|nr:hypothetical protein CEXT_33031 [Caerostris extrusa]